MSTKRIGKIDPRVGRISESAFQARVIVCARANGWRIDLTDVHPRYAAERPVHAYLLDALGKIPLKKLWDFLFGKRQNLFTLVYHPFDSRNSQAGYLDLSMLHPNKRTVLVAELKKVGGYPSLEQRIWLAAWRCCAEGLEGRVVVKLWTPADWDDVVETLGGVDTGLFE